VRYLKRKYETPSKAWDKQVIESEGLIVGTYGLKNKREIWRTQGIVRKYRRLARELAARPNEGQTKEIISKLIGLGVLESGAGLDDVLSLTPEKFFERRLQTVLQRKGLANTVRHARQMIVHGRVKVGDRKVSYPSYIVSREDEAKISVVVAKRSKVEKHAEAKEGTEPGTSTGEAAAS
jgi:small subunit ribosomal protein S4